MAMITKGVTLAMVDYSQSPEFNDSDILKDMNSFPDVLGTASSIDVTTLLDDAHRYIAGLLDNGGNLEFGFIYSKELLNTLYTAATGGTGGQAVRKSFRLKFPDNVTFTWSGTVKPAVDGKGVDEALTLRAVVSIDSNIVIGGLPNPVGPTGPSGVSGVTGA